MSERMITDKERPDIDAIEARAEAVMRTPQTHPWDFIAAIMAQITRTDIPALIAYVRAQDARIRELEAARDQH